MFDRTAALIDILPLGIGFLNARGGVQSGNRHLREWLALPPDATLDEALRGVLGEGWIKRLPRDYETAAGLNLHLSLSESDAYRLLIVEDRSDNVLAGAANEAVLRKLGHDLRSPNATTISMARGVVDGIFEPDREGAERILALAETALRRSERILSVLRAAALSTTRFEPVDLVQVAYETCDACWEAAMQRNAELRVAESANSLGVCYVRGDISLLRQAFQQLTELALAHSKSHTFVLRLSDAGAHWQFQVLPDAADEVEFSAADTFLAQIAAKKHGGSLDCTIAPSLWPLLSLPKLGLKE
jgi:signal transduction histidine kinase